MEITHTNFLSDFSPATCNRAPLVNINENRAKQKLDIYSGYGFIVISYGNSDFDRIKEMISTIKSRKYSYMPIYGSFRENIGEENETQTFEKSFVIFNYNNKQHCEVGEFSKLIQFAIDLAQQFNQDSFLYWSPIKTSNTSKQMAQQSPNTKPTPHSTTSQKSIGLIYTKTDTNNQHNPPSPAVISIQRHNVIVNAM